MELKQICELIRNDGARQTQIAKQKEYAGGENSAILDRRAHEEPDNRIPVPIAGKSIVTLCGYMAKSGLITYSCEDDNYYYDFLKPIFDQNDEGLLTKELFETAAIHGQSYELHFLENGKQRFVEIPVEQGIPIYDDSLPKKLIAFARYYTSSDKKKHLLVYDDKQNTKYIGETFDEKMIFENQERHAYNDVPVCIYKISRNCKNIFDAVQPLIDFYDRIISEDYANEMQRFAESYLLLSERLSEDLDSNGLNEVDKLRITRVFQSLGENVQSKVAFLTKQINDGFLNNAANRFERLIYEMIMIINPNDEQFANAPSGIAMAYKLLQMEYLAASCEGYFSRGLQHRIKLIQNAAGMLSVQETERPQISIQFRRDLPFDLTQAVDQYTKLAGLLPDDVALRLCFGGLLPDIDSIVEQMQEEKNGKEEIPENGDEELDA